MAVRVRRGMTFCHDSPIIKKEHIMKAHRKISLVLGVVMALFFVGCCHQKGPRVEPALEGVLKLEG